MTFLTPWSALLAAAVALPLLLLLYFLKLRRRYVRIASTLLWRSAVEDLQVNTPFQRLRYSLLLVLQMLVMLAVLMAIAQPVSRGDAPAAARTIILVDRSASMGVVDARGRSRLDAARDAARDIVERLGRGLGDAEVMLVAFDSAAEVVCGFESRRRVLLDAIDSIVANDAVGALDPALRLAEAFAARADEGGAPPPEIILLSDGGIAPPEQATGHALGAGGFRFAQVVDPDAPVDNVGIVSFSVRRAPDDPATVQVFARLLNAGPDAVPAVVRLRADGAVVAIERLAVPGAGPAGPGEASLTIPVEIPGGAVLRLEHGRADDLAADDVAWLVLPPRSRPRLALVHAAPAADAFLRRVLESAEPRRLDVMTAAAFDRVRADLATQGERLDGRYDLVVYDGVSDHALPSVPSLTIGGVPAGLEPPVPAPPGGRRILSWQRQHPLMRHVGLDEVVYAGFGAYRVPAAATVLARGAEGPLIALVRSRGADHVMVGFALQQSTWPVDISFTVFMQNVIEQMTASGAGEAGRVTRPGEPIVVRPSGATDDVRLIDRDGAVLAQAAAPATGRVTLAPLRRVGVYEAVGAAPPDDVIAVSLLSDVESDVRPRSSLLVNAREVTASAAQGVVPRPLWPWLLAAAMALLVVEWIVYCARASR